MGKISVIFIFLSISILELSFSKNSELGELAKINYFGPHLPLFHFDHGTRKAITEDDYFEQWYFNSKMQSEFFLLDEYLNGEFISAHYCPESFLTKYESYYRYLIRLLSISYLYEANKEYVFTAKQMGLDKTCDTPWAAVFKSCRPQTKEMKEFLKNVQNFLPHIKEQLVPFEIAKKETRDKWFENYNNGKFENLSQARLASWGEDHKNLGGLNLKNIKGRLTRICEEDQQQLLKICSENDSLFGLSSFLEVYSLLSRSDAMSWMRPNQYQLGCLRRYIQENKNKELRVKGFSEIYSYVYSKKISEKMGFEQGDLFIYGSLKEFTDKGLKEVFSQKKEMVFVEKTIEASVISAPKIEEITLPKHKKVKKKFIPKQVIAKKEYVQKQTAFQSASVMRDAQDLDEVPVDMDKFHFDYIFTREQEKQFDGFVSKFSSQKLLKDMKKTDGLGQKKAPIPLRFFKFLLDKEMHTGLFNIIHVLGEEFYIVNDIDLGNSISFVRMTNSKETNFKWQFKIIRPK